MSDEKDDVEEMEKMLDDLEATLPETVFCSFLNITADLVLRTTGENPTYICGVCDKEHRNILRGEWHFHREHPGINPHYKAENTEGSS